MEVYMFFLLSLVVVVVAVVAVVAVALLTQFIPDALIKFVRPCHIDFAIFQWLSTNNNSRSSSSSTISVLIGFHDGRGM